MKGAIKEGCQRRMKNACRRRGKKTQTRRSSNTYSTRGRGQGHSGPGKNMEQVQSAGLCPVDMPCDWSKHIKDGSLRQSVFGSGVILQQLKDYCSVEGNDSIDSVFFLFN